MSTEPTPPRRVDTIPGWRTGWTWTLLKCGALVAACVAAATGALYYALHSLLGRLPDWLPEKLTRWAFEWALQHLWFLGPAVGVSVGVLLSAGVVVFDAKRGRLKRLS